MEGRSAQGQVNVLAAPESGAMVGLGCGLKAVSLQSNVKGMSVWPDTGPSDQVKVAVTVPIFEADWFNASGNAPGVVLSANAEADSRKRLTKKFLP